MVIIFAPAVNALVTVECGGSIPLNPDLTPKEWSRPINRIDDAAYHHDLAYAKHPDTANRNISNSILINDLHSIPNPTFREQVERVIVTLILYTK